jgi:uncharacterized membrane protein
MSNHSATAVAVRAPLWLYGVCAFLVGAAIVAVAYLPQSIALIAPLAAMLCIYLISKTRGRSRVSAESSPQKPSVRQNTRSSLIYGIVFGVIFIVCILIAWNTRGTGMDWAGWALGAVSAITLLVGYWLPAGVASLG